MPTWKSSTEAYDFVEKVFMAAARIVCDGGYERVLRPTGPRTCVREWVQVYEGRAWFRQQMQRHRLHPAVYDMMVKQHYQPTNWQQMLLEWPHKAITDPNRLAYTRDEKSAMHNGDSDIKAVVTTIGKYLTRHFPDAPDNIIRDLAAQYTYGGTTVITNNMGLMVRAVNRGPRSCMSSDFDLLCDDGQHRHPYAVYDPSLGWSMAVRTGDDGEVLGRCLVHDSDEGKGFVRSYKRERDEMSHSGADEAIEVYLKSLGYTKWSGWPVHVRLMRYPLRRSGFLMPYIDGNCQHVEEHGDDLFCINDYDGYEATNTSGIIDGHEHTCEDCGAGFDDGEGAWIGVGEDTHVCDQCLENDYTYAYSRRGNNYYIPNDDVIEADGEWYDINYLSDNSIVELDNGDYTHIDNAVYVDSQDVYYHVDDDDIVYAEDTRRYELLEDCWCCSESGNYYTNDEESVEIDGDLYHPDHAPEPEEEDDEVEVTAVTDVTIEPWQPPAVLPVPPTDDERFSLAA